MKAKELKIEAPKGYEVDWDNSSMNTIRFKPIKKQITYEDVIINIRATNIGVSVQFGLTKTGEDCFVTSEEQLEQLLALNKLMNVAKYLNGDWEPDWDNSSETKWCLFFDNCKHKITASNLENIALWMCTFQIRRTSTSSNRNIRRKGSKESFRNI